MASIMVKYSMASIMVKYSMVNYIIIILLNHYLLFYLTILPYHVPGTLLGKGDTTVRDTYKVPALRECTFPPLLFPIQSWSALSSVFWNILPTGP